MTYRSGAILNEYDLRPLIQEILDDWAGVSYLGKADISSISGILENAIRSRYVLTGRDGLRSSLDMD